MATDVFGPGVHTSVHPTSKHDEAATGENGVMHNVPPEFPHYDAKVAAALENVVDSVTGLPGFLGIRHVEVGPGLLRAQVDVRDDLKTPFGNLHGGVLAALCDHVLGTVLYPVIPRGAWAATTEFKVNYIAPITTGVLEASARIVSLTKRTAVVRIDVENEARLACAAQGTVLVMSPKTT
jgi:uncharacterized protein (TIGR00369 family)